MNNSILDYFFGRKSLKPLRSEAPPPPPPKEEVIVEVEVLNKPLTLGLLGRDKLTGFTGILSSKVMYLTGCSQWSLVPKCNEKGDVRRCEYFDEGRLEVIGFGVLPEEVILDPKNPGGPNRDCPR